MINQLFERLIFLVNKKKKTYQDECEVPKWKRQEYFLLPLIYPSNVTIFPTLALEDNIHLL